MDRTEKLSRIACSQRHATASVAEAQLTSLARRPKLVPGDTALIAAVAQHVRTHVGPIEHVLHLHPDSPVHVDIHHVPASPKRPFHVFVTSGMSERPMTPPEEATGCDYAELLMLLPATWPVRRAALQQEENRWPLQLLSDLASYPHRHDAWLWEGHTVADAEPPPPLARGVDFCCATLTRPVAFGTEFCRLQESADRAIHFFTVELLYEDEMRFAHRYGASALFRRFVTAGVSPIVDLLRPSLCTDPDLFE